MEADQQEIKDWIKRAQFSADLLGTNNKAAFLNAGSKVLTEKVRISEDVNKYEEIHSFGELAIALNLRYSYQANYGQTLSSRKLVRHFKHAKVPQQSPIPIFSERLKTGSEEIQNLILGDKVGDS